MARPASSRQRLIEELERRGGYVRHRDLLRAGIDPHVLTAMVSQGELERVQRGLYRFADNWSEHTSLATATTAAPEAVVCLLSALEYYDLTTATPSEVYLAIPRKARPPRLEYPPVRVIRYGERMFSHGITLQPLSHGQTVRIFSREKTIADAFHFSNIVSHDVAMEALRTYLRWRQRDVDALLAAAAVCRVLPQLTSYLEALL